MLGWILQRNYIGKKVSYETIKLIEEGEKMGMKLELHDPSAFEIVVTREDRKSVLLYNISTKIPDFLFPRMGATTTYFALALMRHFEKLGVYCINTSHSIETVKDKLFQMQILASNNLPIPKTILAKFPVDTTFVQKQLGYPVIVKALSGSQGSGVFLANDENNLEDFMKMIEITNKESNLILQEFIAGSKGRDLRVFVVGDKVIGAMERYATDDSFKANFSRGGGVRAYKVSAQVEEKVIEITKLFNLKIAGIDLLFDGENFKICEVNSSPGFKGLEQAIEKNVAKEILTYIKDEVRKQ